MARKHQIARLERIYRTIAQHPGERPAQIARRLGEPRSQITRALPALDEHGYLLWEDEKGGLWPFGENCR